MSKQASVLRCCIEVLHDYERRLIGLVCRTDAAKRICTHPNCINNNLPCLVSNWMSYYPEVGLRDLALHRTMTVESNTKNVAMTPG